MKTPTPIEGGHDSDSPSPAHTEGGGRVAGRGQGG